MAKNKTLEEHIEYLKQTVRLSLWIAADWKNKNPNEDFIWILHEGTALVNHTTFNPGFIFDFPTFEGESWPNMRLKLRELYEADTDPESFEERAYKLLEPFIEGRAEKDNAALHDGEAFNQYNSSWIRYDLTKKDDPEGYIEIHMANSLYPGSFLADTEYFNSKLKEAIIDIEKHGFKGLWTKSWLNDLPAWQRFMPKEWNESIHDRDWDIEWHLGFWGQFITANQCFNIKLGNRYRKDGKVMFPMSKARASLESFKKNLDLK